MLDGGREALKRTQVVLLETNFVPHYEGDSLFSTLHRRMTEEFNFELYSLTPEFYSPEGRLVWADTVYARAQA